MLGEVLHHKKKGLLRVLRRGTEAERLSSFVQSGKSV
jgi:hypothetical protein